MFVVFVKAVARMCGCQRTPNGMLAGGLRLILPRRLQHCWWQVGIMMGAKLCAGSGRWLV